MAKILLSAYACEPNKGSEPEVGFQWAINIAKKHEVWILTKSNNKETLEAYKSENPTAANWDNLHFVYIGLPKALTFWKKGNRGMRPYYYLWSKKAYSVAKKLHSEISFDLCHSVTFVSLTQPCFLYKLDIPFVWTVAGGENISKKINYKITFKEKAYEILRKFSQYKTKHSVRINKSLNKASLILATTEDTKNLIPKKYRNKVEITSAIGIESVKLCKEYKSGETVNVLLSGKFIYLKGVRIGIDAIAKVADKYKNAQFTVLGNGPYEKEYKSKLGGYENITFVDKIDHDKIYDFYKGFDFLINTALRDSGCLVAMEAMSVGLPVVCVNTGGVKAMTKESFAIKVEPQKYADLVDEMANGISLLIENPDKRIEMGKEAYQYINREYLYENKCARLLEKYDEIIKGQL